jgi:hypothetical protein
MGLLDIVIDVAAPNGARDRAQQIDEVRAKLAHPKDAWTTGEDGRRVWLKAPAQTADNVCNALLLDPAFRSRLRHNDFSGTIEWDGRLMEDADATEVRLALARGYKLQASVTLTNEMMIFVARMLRYHPVRDWLEGLRWDGTPRMSRLLSPLCRVRGQPLARHPLPAIHDLLRRPHHAARRQG